MLLGAGTGLVAIVLAAVLARMVEGGVWEYEIVTTDLGEWLRLSTCPIEILVEGILIS